MLGTVIMYAGGAIHVTCSWCGRAVEREDGWRLHEQPGARRAAFCRLEHVVPWAMQGAHWEADGPVTSRQA